MARTKPGLSLLVIGLRILVRNVLLMITRVKTSSTETCCLSTWGGGWLYSRVAKGPGSEVRCFRDSFELPCQH